MLNKEMFENKARRIGISISPDGTSFIGGTYDRWQGRNTTPMYRDVITLAGTYAEKGWEELLAKVLGQYNYVYYMRPEHTVKDPSFNLIIFLARPVNIDEYEPLARKIAGKMGIKIFEDISFLANFVMELPAVKFKGNPEGALLEPDKILAEYSDWRNLIEWEFSERTITSIIVSLNADKVPKKTFGPIGAFCRAYTVIEAIEKFTPGIYCHRYENKEYSYTPSGINNGISISNHHFVSLYQCDPTYGVVCNAFDVVRIHLFVGLDDNQPDDCSLWSLPSYKAMMEMLKGDEKYQQEKSKSLVITNKAEV